MFVVSVLVSSLTYLDTLVDQDQSDVQLITWHDDEWHHQAALLSEQLGWTHKRVATSADALAAASGDFLIAWNVYRASADVLASLVAAARAAPEKCGSASANWDPAILWRRDEFGGGTGRKGLAQATGLAIDSGDADTTLIPR
jgi:hypothetical protein